MSQASAILPRAKLTDEALLALEAAIEKLLRGGGPGELELLGHGSLSCVLGWQGLACKRLPPFDSWPRVESYRATFEAYIERLEGRGIHTVESRLQVLEREDGRFSVYCIQPILAADTLAHKRLRGATEAEAEELFRQILEAVENAVGSKLGLDARVANWSIEDGNLSYLDLTGPLIRNEQGQDALDTEIFVAVMPRLARGVVRMFLLQDILDPFYDRRLVICELLANLYNDGLAAFVPTCMQLANRTLLNPPLTEAEILRHRSKGNRLWGFVRPMFRVERFWSRSVRRRPYSLLLPDLFK